VPFHVHHTAATRGRTHRQTQSGLHQPSVTKHGPREITIDMRGEVFGPAARRQALGHRKAEAGIHGHVHDAMRQHHGVVGHCGMDREEAASHQEDAQP
jgi:hypothetical protein